MIFCYSECLVREFFWVQTVENAKNWYSPESQHMTYLPLHLAKVLLRFSVVFVSFVFRGRSAVQFFSNVHVSFVFRSRSAVQFFSNVHVSFAFRGRNAVQFFSNVHVSFAFRVRSAVQFLYLSIFVMLMSVLCSVKISFSYLVMLLFVFCLVIELLVSFFVFVNLNNVHVCCVFRHVQFFLYLVMFMPVLCSVMISFLYLSILDNVIQVLVMYLNLRVYLIVFVLNGYVLLL